MGIFKEVLFWLFIFIVGSLIVNFLIYPETFGNFARNVGSFVEKTIPDKQDKFQPTTILRINFPCPIINSVVDSQLVENSLRSECSFKCGINKLKYYDSSCFNDELICKCKE